MAVTLRYFTEFGKPALQKAICGGMMQVSIAFLVRVQCRRKESSRSLSHLLMSFLFFNRFTVATVDINFILLRQLQSGLVMATSGRLELGDDIYGYHSLHGSAVLL